MRKEVSGGRHRVWAFALIGFVVGLAAPAAVAAQTAAAGPQHTVLVKPDGTVWASGWQWQWTARRRDDHNA